MARLKPSITVLVAVGSERFRSVLDDSRSTTFPNSESRTKLFTLP